MHYCNESLQSNEQGRYVCRNTYLYSINSYIISNKFAVNYNDYFTHVSYNRWHNYACNSNVCYIVYILYIFLFLQHKTLHFMVFYVSLLKLKVQTNYF